ncbi:eCIS core domain-containing protein [Paenibacillus wenxiniae]|uniref:DUF4157 domain-containing protein n=1 Tax=Paenibacillus wenxiniae TaxID=1636843 RepID=A0ABW4RM50_9BACL
MYQSEPSRKENAPLRTTPMQRKEAMPLAEHAPFIAGVPHRQGTAPFMTLQQTLGNQHTMQQVRAGQQVPISKYGALSSTHAPVQRSTNASSAVTDSSSGGTSSNQTGMPDALKSGVESLSGMDMSDVRVHYNSAQPQKVNAHAYAQGSDIHLAPGQDKHLPHEAWHVVQQKQGRVQPTMQLAENVAVNDDVHLEKEATDLGELALSEGIKQRKVASNEAGE